MKETRPSWGKLIKDLANGARIMASLAIACAAVGIVVCMLINCGSLMIALQRWFLFNFYFSQDIKRQAEGNQILCYIEKYLSVSKAHALLKSWMATDHRLSGGLVFGNVS